MLITLVARALQALFSIVVLGLSIALIKGYGPFYPNAKNNGSPPAIHGYGAFCGGAGLLIAIVGIVSCFFEMLQGIVVLALDGVAALFVVAGGIAFAVKAGVGSCDDWSVENEAKNVGSYLFKHSSIFFPSLNKDFGRDDSKVLKKFLEDTSSRCRMVQAETAFLWLMFGTFLLTVGLTFFARTGKRSGTIV